MSRIQRTIARALAVQRPANPEGERSEWEQSFSIIPDFDFSEFDAETAAERKRIEPPDLSFESTGE